MISVFLPGFNELGYPDVVISWLSNGFDDLEPALTCEIGSYWPELLDAEGKSSALHGEGTCGKGVVGTAAACWALVLFLVAKVPPGGCG